MAFYWTDNSAFTSGLCAVIYLLVFCVVVKGQTCQDSEFIKEKSDSYLRNHVKETFQTETVSLCRIMCYLDGACMSYNYRKNTRRCEISDSDHFRYPNDLISKTGYIYVGRKNGCKNTPCPSNAICEADFQDGGFTCLCKKGHTGPNCIALGSRDRPAKSCLDILANGFSNGSGVYVLDPGETGSPFEAYCDMTTDGGGWTKVKRLYLQKQSWIPTKTYTSYEVLAHYNKNKENVILRTSTMVDIYQKLGFHQIHFYCYKKSVGRVVSIMTKNNTAGHDVIRFFTNQNEPVSSFPKACDSFDPLPEDTSILAQNCSFWGREKNNAVGVNKWGSYNYRYWFRFNNYPFGIEGDKNVAFSYSRYRCDDDDDTSVDINDTWQIAVR